MWFDISSWSNEPNFTMDNKLGLKNNQKMLSVKDKTKYKKKTTAAFPKRSSSLQTARTLQANNRSLALSLEKMRHEFLRAHTHLTRLRKNNNLLKEEVYELKHCHLGKTFEKELNKICKERFGTVRKKIFVLNNLATEFVDTLTDLSEICFSTDFSEPVILSRISSPCSTPNNRRADDACCVPSHTDERSDYEVLDASLKPCPLQRNSRLLERSFNKDQTSLSSSNGNISALSDSPLFQTSNSDSSASLYIKKQRSQSKLSLNRQSRRQKKQSHKSLKNVASKINLTKFTDSPLKTPKQETPMKKSNGITSGNTIKDTPTPQHEVGGHRDGKNEKIGTNAQSVNQDSGDVELKATTSAENKHRKRNDVPSKDLVWSSSSLEELSVLTFDMPSELVKPHKSHKSDSHKKRSSPMRKPHNHKKNSNNFSSIDMNKAGNFSSSHVDMDKAGNFSSSHVDMEQGTNVKKNLTNINCISANQHCCPSYEMGKRSFLPNNGTENLAHEKRDGNKHDRLSNITLSASSTCSRDKIKTDALKTYSVKKKKQKEHKLCMTKSERFLGELQMSNSDLFSHDRKTLIEDTEDQNHGTSCRNNLRPKNVKAGKIGNHVRRNSQLGFDFKDKSHMLSSSKRHKVKPVNDLSANQFSLSPPLYVRRDSSTSRNKKRGTKQYSSAEVKHTNNSSSKQVVHFLSSLNYSTQEILFGKNLPVTDITYGTDSHSQYGEDNQCKNNKRKVKKNILSKLKQIQSKINSVGIKINDPIKPIDVSPELTESAPELTESAAEMMTHCRKLVNSEELLNIDASDSRVIIDDEAISCTDLEMSNFTSVESETSFKTNTTYHFIPVENKAMSLNSLDPRTEMVTDSSRTEKKEDAFSVSISCSDIKPETWDTLPNSYMSAEPKRLEKEGGDTSESLVSLSSSIENLTSRREIEKLMDDIKQVCSSLNISLPNSEETSCNEYECSEFLTLSDELDSKCEETNTIVEDMQNTSDTHEDMQNTSDTHEDMQNTSDTHEDMQNTSDTPED